MSASVSAKFRCIPVNCLCTWFRFDQDAAGVRFGAQSLQEQGQEGSVAISAPIETKDELIETGLEVLGAQPVADAPHPALEVAERGVGPGENFMGLPVACLGTPSLRILSPRATRPSRSWAFLRASVGGEASDDDPLVGRLAPDVAGAAVDDEGLGAGGLDTAPEPGEPVVPGDPGLVGGLEGRDGPLGQVDPDFRDALAGTGFGSCPAVMTVQGAVWVSTAVNARMETEAHGSVSVSPLG